MSEISNLKKSGCIFSFVIDIISVMWVVAAIIMIRGTITNLYLIFNSSEMEQKSLIVLSTEENSSGSPKGGQFTVHVLRGNVEDNDDEVKTVFTSRDLSYNRIQSIKDAKKLDIWYLPYRGGSLTAPLPVYPEKSDYINHVLTSLLLIFFIPLVLLIRLIYYHGRAIRHAITAPYKS